MIQRALPAGSRRRAVAFFLAALVATIVFTQLLLPGRGDDPRGTPSAILFQAVVQGLVTSLTAIGIVLVYRTIRIINFAQTAIGAAGAVFLFNLVQFTVVPFPIAFILGLALSALIGLVFDLAFGRRFAKAPRLVLTVFTIAMASFLGQVSAQAVQAIPFFPPGNERTIEQLLGSEPITRFLPFAGFSFEVGGLPLKFGFAHLFAIDVVIIALLAVNAFFRMTRAGVAVRAMAENSERAALLGISVGGLSSIVWAIAGALSGATISLTGMMTVPGVAVGFAPGVLFMALAAAVIGRMEKLSVTVLASVVISVVSQSAIWSLPRDVGLVNFGVFLAVGIALLVQRRRGIRSEAGAGVSWQATEEQRPIPKELATVGSIRFGRIALALLGVAVVMIYPFVTSTGATNLGGVIALNAIVAISLVILTGWAGQVSLGQYAFAAVGAVVAGSLTGRVGIPGGFWVAVPIATVVSGAVAALIGIPALRIRGLFLAVVTFGFAIAVSGTLFNRRYFGWMLPDDIERPELFFLDFGDERSMYFLCVVALILSVLVLLNLRRSRVGRILIASRENESNLQSFGVSVLRTKLVAFAASGALCGFAGAIFVHQQRGLSGESFGAGASLQVFLLAVIGGVGSVGGALLGATYFRVVEYFFSGNIVIGFLQGFVTLLILYIAPGGMISLVGRLRDAVLRIVAQRRQIIVPSFFADADPLALEKRLVPLADPLLGSGLAALPPGERYALPSELYAGTGVRFMSRLEEGGDSAEQAALGAAADSMSEGAPGNDLEPVTTTRGSR